MYRVELKDITSIIIYLCSQIVPNVPCGVERINTFPSYHWFAYAVPNVPCGVERSYSFIRLLINSCVSFLMYRVELKVVPGVGVVYGEVYEVFLMYRVELKDIDDGFSQDTLKHNVPNVPCGVESKPASPSDTAKDFVPNVPCGVES